MPRIEDRVCPSCGERCGALLRACPKCKHPFDASAPRARLALQKPSAQVDPAPPPPTGTAQAAAPPTAQVVPPARAQVALVKPRGLDVASQGAQPVALGSAAQAPDPRPAAHSPDPVIPPVPPRGATIPMGPDQAALAMAATAAASGNTAPALRGPTATPVVPSAPPRSDPRRSAANTWAVAGIVLVVGAGVLTAALWNRSGGDDDSGASGTTIELPPPPATVKADPTPVPTDIPSSDPPAPVPSGSDSPPFGTTTAPGNTDPPGRKAGLDGWIPESATQATRVADLHADPDHDPLCATPESPVQIGKEIAVAFEKELREATKISDAEESRIGARLESAIGKDPSFAGKWDLPEDVARYGEYLSSLLAHVAKGKSRAGIQYRIHIVRKRDFNAGALPGGVLMVNTGALDGDEAVANEAELVAVIGHEIAHVEKRHTIASYQYAKAMFGEDQDAQIAMKILSTPISSQYEMEADESGLKLALSAQYDPQAGVDLWRRRAKTERPAPGGLLGDVLDSLIRSHPKAAVRACQAMKMVTWAHDHARWARVYDGKTNLRTRIIGPRKTY